MANVLNRTTMEYLESQNTPDFTKPEVAADWIINPDLSAVRGISHRYWKLVDDAVVEMPQDEKDVVDSAAKAARGTTDIKGVDVLFVGDQRIDLLAAHTNRVTISYPKVINDSLGNSVSCADALELEALFVAVFGN
jgi:hypothetical protein